MYQYAVTFTRHLLECDQDNRYVVFHDYEGIEQEQLHVERARLVKVHDTLVLGLTILGRKIWTPRGPRAQRLLRRLRRAMPWAGAIFRGDFAVFGQYGAELVLQPSHVSPDAALSGLPYLVAIHDAPFQWTEAHRKTRSPAFLQWYENLIAELARGASRILVDSVNGQRAMTMGYGADPAKICILPFQPPDYILRPVTPAERVAAKARFTLPVNFLFYPSKFHAHKNHIVLLEALHKLRSDRGLSIPLVLAGTTSNDDTYDRVIRRIEELGLSDQIIYLGYVDDADMATIYSLATALVFPTLMGPTAIPILEAFAAGCPVICSNVEGFPDQVSDAGLLIDPQDSAALAEAIAHVFSSERLRNELVEKGHRRFRELTTPHYGIAVRQIVATLVSEIQENGRRKWSFGLR